MRYEVHVAGIVFPQDLGDDVRELDEPGTVEHEVCTVLSGRFADQAALHGFLHRLWGKRLQVVRVRRTGD